MRRAPAGTRCRIDCSQCNLTAAQLSSLCSTLDGGKRMQGPRIRCPQIAPSCAMPWAIQVPHLGALRCEVDGPGGDGTDVGHPPALVLRDLAVHRVHDACTSIFSGWKTGMNVTLDVREWQPRPGGWDFQCRKCTRYMRQFLQHVANLQPGGLTSEEQRARCEVAAVQGLLRALLVVHIEVQQPAAATRCSSTPTKVMQATSDSRSSQAASHRDIQCVHYKLPCSRLSCACARHEYENSRNDCGSQKKTGGRGRLCINSIPAAAAGALLMARRLERLGLVFCSSLLLDLHEGAVIVAPALRLLLVAHSLRHLHSETIACKKSAQSMDAWHSDQNSTC